MEANTTMKVDAKAFILKCVQDGIESVKYAYDSGNNFDEYCAHTALQMVCENLMAIQNFMNSLS